jgi:hypothetical protein
MFYRRITRVEQSREEALNATKLIVAVLTGSAANVALAGVVPLGAPLGRGLGLTLGGVLGTTLGFVLGSPLGSVVPIASVTLLTVAALSLAVGIYIVRHKRHR